MHFDINNGSGVAQQYVSEVEIHEDNTKKNSQITVDSKQVFNRTTQNKQRLKTAAKVVLLLLVLGGVGTGLYFLGAHYGTGIKHFFAAIKKMTPLEIGYKIALPIAGGVLVIGLTAKYGKKVKNKIAEAIQSQRGKGIEPYPIENEDIVFVENSEEDEEEDKNSNNSNVVNQNNSNNSIVVNQNNSNNSIVVNQNNSNNSIVENRSEEDEEEDNDSNNSNIVDLNSWNLEMTNINHTLANILKLNTTTPPRSTELNTSDENKSLANISELNTTTPPSSTELNTSDENK